VLPAAPILSPAEQLESARALIRSNVAQLWPTLAAGEPLTVEVGTGDTGRIRVRVVHLGAALARDGAESLSRGLGAALGREVELVTVAIPEGVLTRSNGDLDFVTRVASAVRASASTADVNVCVVQPRVPQQKRRRLLRTSQRPSSGSCQWDSSHSTNARAESRLARSRTCSPGG
jgi:hypothetical protein